MKNVMVQNRWLIAALVLLLEGIVLPPLETVSAQMSAEHYTDVEAGVWYEQAADALLGAKALDESETRLRPNELATRAEVAKLLVLLNDRQLVFPRTPGFSDVPRSAWYYSYMETAAQAGWFRGDGNCYAQGRSVCYGRPAAPVNRAEMAIILQRAFVLGHAGSAPIFPDNVNERQWYFLPIQIAADHCILQGDDFTGLVRPAASMNRAEMIVMFYRASLDLQYGEDCAAIAEPRPDITGVTSPTSRRVRVTFNVDLDPNRMDDTQAYAVERVAGGASLGVDSVTVLNGRTVELALDNSMSANATYRVIVDNMRTEGGTVFDDTRSFVFEVTAAEPFIEAVTVRSAGMLRIRFSQNMLRSSADDTSRYTVTISPGGSELRVRSAAVIDERTVDLALVDTLASQTTYRLFVDRMLTENRDEFSDEFAFVTGIVELPVIQEVLLINSTRLRLHFSESMNEARAEDEFRYRVMGFNGDVNVDSAIAIDDDTVEIVLGSSLQLQAAYTISVISLQTTGGVVFSDQIDVIFVPSGSSGEVRFDALLNGNKEIPPVTTSAVGTGSFILTVNGLEYDITLGGISGSSVTAAHFHRGNATTEGPAIETITFTGLRARGTWTNLTTEERANLLDEDIYVNIHTSANADGEIRGQVELQ